MSLSFVLHAKNSSGHQMLFIDRDAGDEINLTLCGEHEGQNIQIDFNSISGGGLGRSDSIPVPPPQGAQP